MDGTAAINHNREALKRILSGLVAMAGLADALTSPLRGGRREASGGGCDAEETPTRRSDDRRPPPRGEVGSPPASPAMAASMATMRFSAQWFLSIARFQSIAASFQGGRIFARGRMVWMNCGEEKCAVGCK